MSAGDSFKDKLNSRLLLLGILEIDRGRIFLGYIASLLEPVGVILLLLGGLVALKFRRVGALCGWCGALFALMPTVWPITLEFASYQSLSFSVELSHLESIIQGLGSGYWLTIIGCVLGLVGALAGWLERSRNLILPPQPQGRPALRIRPGAVLVLCSWLVVAASMFAVPFFSIGLEGSLFDIWSQPSGLGYFWPVPLALLLLLASGVMALAGWKAAYLGSLSGALVGLTFLLLILVKGSFLQAIFPYISMGVGSWLLLMGCVLGLLGVVLGLLERPSSPVPAEALLAPLPS